jgi:hypothetical protein
MIITHHAVQRFQERFAPQLDYKSAKDRLICLLSEAEELLPPTLWRYVAKRNFWEDCEYYRHDEAGVVFAIKLSEDEGSLLMTCLPDDKGVPPPKGTRHGGAKYRGRMDVRLNGAYKRNKLFKEEDDA